MDDPVYKRTAAEELDDAAVPARLREIIRLLQEDSGLTAARVEITMMPDGRFQIVVTAADPDLEHYIVDIITAPLLGAVNRLADLLLRARAEQDGTVDG